MKYQREAIMNRMSYPSRLDAAIANKVSRVVRIQVDKMWHEIAQNVYHDILRKLVEQYKLYIYGSIYITQSLSQGHDTMILCQPIEAGKHLERTSQISSNSCRKRVLMNCLRLSSWKPVAGAILRVVSIAGNWMSTRWLIGKPESVTSVSCGDAVVVRNSSQSGLERSMKKAGFRSDTGVLLSGRLAVQKREFHLCRL